MLYRDRSRTLFTVIFMVHNNEDQKDENIIMSSEGGTNE